MLVEIRAGDTGYETARLGSKTAVEHGSAEARMRALGAPVDLANGERFEKLAAEKRAGIPNGVTVNPAAQDEHNRARAAELAKII